MHYGKLDAIDKPISRLVQGTIMVVGDDEEKEFALLDAVNALGCTTFDTGHVYGNGRNERAVGKWVRERGLREQVVIISKGAHHSQDRKRVTPFDISADIHDSLARFQFDYLDLYLLHRDDPEVPVEAIVDRLNEHLEAGHIRAFGGSNWSHERIDAANAYARANGLKPMIASSPNFSLAEQVELPWPGCISISGDKGQEARAYYREQKMPLFTWSSLAGGFFSGRFTRDNLDSFTAYLEKLCVTSYCYEVNFKKLDRVKQMAEDKGLSVPQIATAYVMSYPLDIYALVGCQTPDEFKQNMEAMALELSAEEISWLEEG
jgi:aryl-alcohol dehydrogenase-like predicted oxidoreductase